MADIFLSYAREDWERIRPLALCLEGLGWSLWWDTRMRAGRRFDEMIETEIAAARCVVVVWTERSVKSDWVRAEAAEALERDRLIPLFLDGVKPPLLFRNVQGLDFQAWDGSADDPAFLRLVDDAAELAGAPADRGAKAPTEPPRSPAAPSPPPPSPRPRPRAEAAVPAAATGRDPGLPEPEMVRIEPGVFLMGCPEGEHGDSDERPQHQVRIPRPFAIGKYAVTFDEYDAFARATRWRLPGDEDWGRGRRPVINVSWEDAVAYARWLSERTGKTYRLPTEAEWEYAARAGMDTAWSFGSNEGDLGQFAWYLDNSDYRTHPVGEKASNPWGLYDVHGNVWEWVQDCLNDSYQGAPGDGSAREDGNCDHRVVRGGSWGSGPWNLRSAGRSGFGPDRHYTNVGFRVAQDL